MKQAPTPAYGSTRGAAVSYLEVERAAIAILKAGQRPSVERVRTALGRGSPQTLLSALQRFWRDLGTRVEADPAALTRLPGEIVESVEAIWQRALTLASQAAKHEDNAARERLSQLQLQNELRAQSFALREQEYETTARARERVLAVAQEHLRALMGMLEKDRLALRSSERRIVELQSEVDDYRRRLAELIARTVARQRAASKGRPAVPRRRGRAARPAPTGKGRRAQPAAKSRRGSKR